MDNVFLDIGLILIIATFAGLLAKRLNQPFIPSYIFAGFIAIPLFALLQMLIDYLSRISFIKDISSGHDIAFIFIRDTGVINIISEIAITFLLFIVGLEISIKKIKDVGHIAIFGGIFQLLVTFVIVFVASVLFGYNGLMATLIGVAFAFSSTMVVLKILSDKGEIDTLHGKIAIGFLLMQDLVAIFALVMIKSTSFSINQVWQSLFVGVILILFAIFMSKNVFPKLFKFAAKSHELLFLAALSSCFFFSLLFGLSGFSMAIGAFIAGISLANLPYSFEIIGKVKSLRDFFATIFFVVLGMQIEISGLTSLIPQIIIFTLIIVIVKPMIIYLIVTLFGYKSRTALSSAISLAQISEFSIILITLGLLDTGLINEYPNVPTMIIILAAISMAISNYFIKYEGIIHSKFHRQLEKLEKYALMKKNFELSSLDKNYDVVLCGYDRTAHHIYEMVKKVHESIIILDFNPEIIKKLISEKVPCIYGDIGNTEVLEKINFSKCKLVVSTIPDKESSVHLLKWSKKQNANSIVFLTSYHLDDALDLYKEGADYVILPHFLGGYHAGVILEETANNFDKLLKKRLAHIKELHKRRNLGHGTRHIHPSIHHH